MSQALDPVTQRHVDDRSFLRPRRRRQRVQAPLGGKATETGSSPLYSLFPWFPAVIDVTVPARAASCEFRSAQHAA
jgi:hypothetical protein